MPTYIFWDIIGNSLEIIWMFFISPFLPYAQCSRSTQYPPCGVVSLSQLLVVTGFKHLQCILKCFSPFSEPILHVENTWLRHVTDILLCLVKKIHRHLNLMEVDRRSGLLSFIFASWFVLLCLSSLPHSTSTSPLPPLPPICTLPHTSYISLLITSFKVLHLW